MQLLHHSLTLVPLLLANTFFTAISGAEETQRVPLIFDNDANYDDTLALMYLASNPLFDLMAATTAGSGYGTLHGGPINMQQVLTLFGKDKDTPVSYGQPISLEPMSAFPLQWRIETDEFFQAQNLPDSDMPLSVYQSDQLIAKILRESPVAVAVAVTGPATNLAIALRREPELINRISSIFIMGSNYGGGPNNVYDWQMTFNGVIGSCPEDASYSSFVPNQAPLSLTLEDGSFEMVSTRPGCRGNSMSDSGDTEWNVFLDALAWHVVTRMAAEAGANPPMIYAITSGATEDMPITMEDFEEGVKSMGNEKQKTFITSLAQAFLGAGEAMWWDAQLVVAMAEVITGVTVDESVCSEWLDSTGFKVNLDWHSVSDEEAKNGTKNPYGSITDVDGIGPAASFCRHGNVTNMQDTYWSALKGDPGSTTIADPSIYLRSLAAPNIDTISVAKTESVGGSSSSSSGLTMVTYLLVGIPLLVSSAW